VCQGAQPALLTSITLTRHGSYHLQGGPENRLFVAAVFGYAERHLVCHAVHFPAWTGVLCHHIQMLEI